MNFGGRLIRKDVFEITNLKKSILSEIDYRDAETLLNGDFLGNVK